MKKNNILRCLIRLSFIFSLVIFLLPTKTSATCSGIAFSGDYSYEVYTTAGTVYFKLHPLGSIVGSASAIIYLREGTGTGTYPGYTMTASGGDFIFSKSITNGTITSFYFSYSVPAGGEANSSAHPHAYLTGTDCVTGAPSVSITSPAEAASFTAPAGITINASASDLDGTVTKVEFYSGVTLLGEDLSSPYSFVWTNVVAGSYTLTAKATDNNALSSISIPVNIVVNAPNTNGYCGTAFSGDYEYKAETNAGVVTFTMHPLTPISGSLYSLIYIREGLSGGYAGYSMNAIGADFIFTKSIGDATPVSFYFTYQVPAGGEANSSIYPHSYTVGTNCTGVTGIPTINIVSPINSASYTELATITINANAIDTDGSVSKVDFYNGAVLLNTDLTFPYSYTWTNVPAGNYNISARVTDNNSLSSLSALVHVVVNINNSAGFCGTVPNADYFYKAETIAGNVVFSFHPLTPIAGCSYVYIYVREGLTGVYPGYAMTAIGSDFRFTKAITNATPLSIYFTYQVPSGGERNSSLTPHSYTVGDVCIGTVVPVNLFNYTAKLQIDGSVAINWATNNELNNDHYIIEKSLDGRSFNLLGNVLAKAGMFNIKEYQFIDKFPFAGRNFYRLTQVDKDGRSKVYDIKSISFSENKSAIQVYPNPLTGDILNIQYPRNSEKLSKIQLVGMDGKVCFTGSFSIQEKPVQVKLTKKPVPGIYLLKVGATPSLKLNVQ